MDTVKLKSSEMKHNLHNYQVDFVKLKLYDVDINKINWEKFTSHPNLKNHYTLNSSDEELHGKNFDMYIDKGNNVTIRMSVPYLIENHNYKAIENYDLALLLIQLKQSTGLNFPDARVLEFEFGAFERIPMSTKDYLHHVNGILDYDLLKNTSYMHLYGNTKLQYKLYDAVANAKRKKTFARGNFPEGNLIKHELRFVVPRKTFGNDVIAFDLSRECFIKVLKEILHSQKQSLILRQSISYKPKDTSMLHLLFTALKNIELDYPSNVFSVVSEVIDSAKLTPSQKSKRRKTLMELETAYNAG
ncbi:MAG: hypothetical protein ACK5MD_10015 [Flavobacteriales bacterium]